MLSSSSSPTCCCFLIPPFLFLYVQIPVSSAPKTNSCLFQFHGVINHFYLFYYFCNYMPEFPIFFPFVPFSAVGAPLTLNTTLKFCSYNGSSCCNSTEDSQLQRQFQAMNISHPSCASLLQSVLCAVRLSFLPLLI